MRNYKKILAAGLAVSMVMGSSVVALAEDQEGGTSGTGGLEGSVSTDVFSVVLPSVPESGDTTFDYILDPEGLIAKAGADKYAGKTFEENATLFFANTAEGAAKDYSSTSDALKVINKSSSDVAVEVKATIASIDGITMSDDKSFADDTNASLYLALKDSNAETAITGEEGASLSATIDAAAEDAYEVQWNATDNKYENVLTDEAKADDYTGFSAYTFQMTGACNAAGDWSGLTETAPVVNVVWSVKDPFVTGPQVNLNTSGVISIANLDGTLYSSMSLNDGTNDWPLVSATDGTWVWDDAADAKKEFTLASNWMPSYLAGKTVVITVNLKDGTSITSAPVTFSE